VSLDYQTDEETRTAGELDAGEPVYVAPRPVCTIILILGIAAVFVAQLAVGINISAELAGFDKPAFLARHEYWRILTGATTHGSLLHVFMNCYAFYSFGRIVELISNRAHLAVVFLCSAIAGGVLSLIFVPDGLSVGASGGIVGLIGYLAVYAFRRRRFVSAEFRKSLLINIGFILVFGLALYQVIDNYGHIGGLVFGALYGLVQIPSDEYVDPRAANPITSLAGLAAVGIYLAACAFSILLIFRTV
jgi:membrane associated rhomboid family serine protease